jgi:predicted phage gp36 major capsid-like protein
MDRIEAEVAVATSEATSGNDETKTVKTSAVKDMEVAYTQSISTEVASGGKLNEPARIKDLSLAFVLAPPDFGSQNILVNPETGDVTAIIN